MKKVFLLGAIVCAIGMMTACKSGTAETTEVESECPIVSDIYVELARPDTVLTPFEMNGKWGYLYDNGDTAISPVYDSATPFINGKATIVFEGVRYIMTNEEDGGVTGVPEDSDL